MSNPTTHHHPLSRLRLTILLFGLTLVLSIIPIPVHAAGNGFIEDDAHVLNVNEVSQAAKSFPYELDIFTTNAFVGDAGQLASSARQHISSTNSGVVVLLIDTRNHHLALVGNTEVSFTDQQYQSAVQAFASTYRQRSSYTDATIALIHTLSGNATDNAFVYAIIVIVFLLVLVFGLRYGWFTGVFLVVGGGDDDSGSNSGGGALGSF